ncbi:hypothetical protein FOZG_02251 [Fusarium oxysporum Fo47]|uniref:Uncharacterized protein n=1 Tax=Fusarium oxysporum Fo47 TaxID=660027 RepID=W9LDR6_FUSOX|nr:hypothetical protein FOZG_02251 [Fusarium oxysporum Fo47]
MGIYCNWYTALDDYNSGVITHELVIIGAFSRNVGYYESHAPQTDSGGLCWNPSQPVTAIYEQGPVLDMGNLFQFLVVMLLLPGSIAEDP